MIIRAIDDSGDWQWGQSLQSFNTGTAAIAENLKTRLLTFMNDAFWAMNFAVDWWNLLGAKNPQAEAAIILQVREAIIGAPGGYPSYGVTAINSVSVSMDSKTRRLSIDYSVQDIYSQTITGTVSP